MTLQVKQVNRFFLILTAPFLGLFLWLIISSAPLQWSTDTEAFVPTITLDTQTQSISKQLSLAENTAQGTLSSIRKSAKIYQSTLDTTSSIVKQARIQALIPERIYNQKISAKLGTPYERVNSDRISIELFKVNTGYYRGHAMKVKLKDPTAMQMSLGNDTVGGSETTLQAVKRTRAIAGINAGGFADGGGKRYPLSTTVMNGQYLTGFESSYKDLSFVGLDQSGKLIGGKFHNKQDLDVLEPSFGATFVPTLLENGQIVPIPVKWQTSPVRAPRTVIGNYKDDQILILVIDGYNENGSSGATLKELQSKMFHLGVRNAYNLDGGGSSSLILNDKIINKPSDGNLRQLPTNFLFFK
ncbi:phosphodiester glycosidase family protein [Paenibacillus sp. IHBB 10380]|uniref:phosphodiester glycosidase family protein n=1 Tax=Paenibacillus sp. IHBB 10380 TaxID=1566358 RepID=UPI0005CF9C7B|nr:phosphodiester glycosidase family protein [Paenibacillus sp. IHBB 10380]AJS59644.1 exopolysaccharide biosynthesis protein [Paenibacillus sp. IHBB 10380]